MLTSCSLFDSGGDVIKGRYNIGWIDLKANRSINYALKEETYGGSEKVGAFVRQMGCNDRYIIAERIYFDMRKMDKPDYDSVSYYIVDMAKESDYKDDDVLGPFNKEGFDTKKIELGIKDLKFTEKYYDY